jgi:hypothetical protein
MPRTRGAEFIKLNILIIVVASLGESIQIDASLNSVLDCFASLATTIVSYIIVWSY